MLENSKAKIQEPSGFKIIAPSRINNLLGPFLPLLRLIWRIQGMAIKAILAYWVRSVFIVLAVALGISALTIIVAAVEGGRNKAMEVVEIFGPDTIMVLGGDIVNRPVGQRTNTLTWDDVRAIRSSLPGAYLSVPMKMRGGVTIKYGSRFSQTTQIIGSSEDYAKVWNWPLSEGRDITAEDVNTGAKVGIIGRTTAQELFGDETPIGKTIFAGTLPVQIIGQMVYRGVSGGGGSMDADDRLVIPISTITQRFNMDRKYFRAIRVKFLESENMAAHAENLKAFLRHLHNLESGQNDDFSILTAQEILSFLTIFTGGIVVFLGITAVVAVIVGGFVLANLLFLSVSERSQEIGLRKALGASSKAITAQFLSEAVYMTLAGAVLGLTIGILFANLLSSLEIIDIKISPTVFILSFLSSLLIALVFGLKPAKRAASISAINALRGGNEEG